MDLKWSRARERERHFETHRRAVRFENKSKGALGLLICGHQLLAANIKASIAFACCTIINEWKMNGNFDEQLQSLLRSLSLSDHVWSVESSLVQPLVQSCHKDNAQRVQFVQTVSRPKVIGWCCCCRKSRVYSG